MHGSKIKVLYIAGFERSGSTLVNRVLGQIDGFVAWGELRDIWEHGELENRNCTCGETFKDCSAWSRILDNHFYRTLGLSAADMLKLKKRSRAAVLLSSLVGLDNLALSGVPLDYLAGLEQLYRTMLKETESEVIVDSTKASWYGYVLSQMPNIDLYVVHVVRDPRGVCFSLQKRKDQGEPECQWYNPLHGSLSWLCKNSGVERLLNTGPDRYMRVRYEDFVKFPEQSVQSILSFMNEGSLQLPFVRPSTVQMQLDHIITGSPSSRSALGDVQLYTDESWKAKISPISKQIVTHVAAPLLFKYGYSYRV